MPDDDTHRILRQTLELTRENNKILHRMRRSAFIGSILRIVWLAVIIGLPVYIYFVFLQPYLTSLNEAYQGFQADVEGYGEIPESVRNFFEKLPGGSVDETAE